jgi:hypothetical protein
MTLSFIMPCHYAECHILFIAVMNVIMLSVIMLNVDMLIVVEPSLWPSNPNNVLTVQGGQCKSGWQNRGPKSQTFLP